MCCQDGDGAIWQMLYEPAGWPTEAESSLPVQEQQQASEERPTAAAELMISLVAIPDQGAAKSAFPLAQPRNNWQVRYEPAGWSAEAEAESSLPVQEQQQASEERPTAAAELMISLVAIPDQGAAKSAFPRPAMG